MTPVSLQLAGFDIWVLWTFSSRGLILMEFGLDKPPPSLFISLEEKRENHPDSWDREMKKWLKDYEKRRFSRFPLPLDLSETSPFQAIVLQTLTDQVSAGQTVSYQELAALSGRPMAHRAVGSTMAGNSLAFAVPCHRVMHSGNSQTSYGKGVFYKWLLMSHERGDEKLLKSMKDRYRHTFPIPVPDEGSFPCE